MAKYGEFKYSEAKYGEEKLEETDTSEEVIEAEIQPVEVETEAAEFKGRHLGDPCVFCGIAHDDVGIGPCCGVNSEVEEVLAWFYHGDVLVEPFPYEDGFDVDALIWPKSSD